MASRALVVAAVASVLFVAVIGVDIAMNRVYRLEVQQADGSWTLAAEHPPRYAWVGPELGRTPMPFNASDTVRFRLVADNGYPWALSERWSASLGGVQVADGVLEAPARGVGVAEFTLTGRQILDAGYGAGFAPKEPVGERLVNPWMQLRVGDESFEAYLSFREVSE